MNITISSLTERDLPEADRVFRLAFGTFLGLPDPTSFMGDADLVKSRWRAAPDAALGAFAGETLIGSNAVTEWGSFGFFGPLSIRPDYWGRGIAQQLMVATMEMFRARATRTVGLFTFPNSPQHIHLYRKFGFWPRFLTEVMSKSVTVPTGSVRYTPYSTLSEAERSAVLHASRGLTGSIEDGLDVTREIQSVVQQRLGDTVLIYDDGELVGLAVCHLGPGSEAGSDTAYVKFGAVRQDAEAPRRFNRLLLSCEALAAERGLGQLVAGVNTERQDACRGMARAGFRVMMNGVAMLRANEPGHNRADCFVIDDWR